MLATIKNLVLLLNNLAKAIDFIYHQYKKHKLEKEYERAEKDPYGAFRDHFSK